MARRITIDLTDAADAEIERMLAEHGLSTPDLFRLAMSVLRTHPKAVADIKRFAAAHHHQQPAHALLHALTVDIPALCDAVDWGHRGDAGGAGGEA